MRNYIQGLKRSVNYIQDFLNIPGEKLWREELARLINFAVEKEATVLINKKVSAVITDETEKFHTPIFKPIDDKDFTFMGRLLSRI
jgi:WASH complex subunit strumpellin